MIEKYDFEIDRIPVNGFHVLSIRFGKISLMPTVQELKSMVEKNIKPNTQSVLMDLHEITLLNSQTMGILAAIKINLDKKNIDFVVVINALSEGVLRMCNMDKILHWDLSREEALRALTFTA